MIGRQVTVAAMPQRTAATTITPTPTLWTRRTTDDEAPYHDRTAGNGGSSATEDYCDHYNSDADTVSKKDN
jgi:hypothetical protein